MATCVSSLEEEEEEEEKEEGGGPQPIATHEYQTVEGTEEESEPISYLLQLRRHIWAFCIS